MVKVHGHYPAIEFHAPLCGIAFLFKVIATIFTIAAPLLLALASDGFWETTDVHREQPRVRFTNDVMMLVEGAEVGETFTYSTFPSYNTLAEKNLLVPTIKSHEVDLDGDSINDRFHITVEVPVAGTQNIHHFRLFLFFDYWIQNKLAIKMKSMAVVDVASPLPGGNLWVDGDLRFNQRAQLNRTGRDTQYDSYVVPTESFPTSATPYLPETILSSYHDRLYGTSLRDVDSVWKSRRGSASTFTATITVRYPVDSFHFNNDLTAILKHAFIEFAVLYFFVLVLFNPVVRFVFTNQLLPVTVLSPFEELSKKRR